MRMEVIRALCCSRCTTGSVRVFARYVLVCADGTVGYLNTIQRSQFQGLHDPSHISPLFGQIEGR